ncbi:glycosyltransferase family 8 protein [Lewinella sp. IMCC34183]|uniref:glycosyltransferase family 8 protein n=1 Tax=Lewinella sp. IMCC34183 TaxID=2248762 RepID=UPI000E2212B2|nr:glycosyltransferase family 8 protein [Lewinella sp. IMCC34183]
MHKENILQIVFNVNEGGLPGLGATINSLLQSTSQPERINFHIMCSRLSEDHQNNIHKLFEYASFPGTYELINYDANTDFKSLPGLHNDLTPYGRLLIPQYIDAEKVIYLDSDLVITIDIFELDEVDMSGHSIAAYTGTFVNYTLDREYFVSRGYSQDMPYFNSGVLIMNLAEWRRRDLDTAWREIILDRPETLRSHDQTILNRMCDGDFKQLPKKFNTSYLAGANKPSHPTGIFHFLGSPKPWDLFGSIIHGGYSLWKRFSPPFWEREYQRMTIGRLDRAWYIRRSIIRVAKKRYAK